MSVGKIFFNLTALDKELSRMYSDASEAKDKDKTKKTLEYFLFLLKNYEDGVIGPKKFAYDVGATMSFDFLDSPLNEIAHLGGTLEVPDKHVDCDPKVKMQEMIDKIKTQAEKFDVKLNLNEIKGGSKTYEYDY